MKELPLGLRGYAETLVNEKNTASALGSGSLPVFATPSMIALMEQAAADSVQDYLDPGESSVGTRLEVSHLSASPLGARIRAESELIAVDRRMLRFSVRAYEGETLIGEGLHERFVIQVERFLAKLMVR